MNKVEKRTYVLLFIFLVIIAGILGAEQAEKDHRLNKTHPNSTDNEYTRLVHTLEAHKQFNSNK